MKNEEIESLLPWYVNGTLSADEKAKVESALNDSENLRQELAFLEALSNTTKSEKLNDASELGWRRLQKQIQNEAIELKPNVQPQITKQLWFKPFIASAAMLIIAIQIGLTVNKNDDVGTQLLSATSIVLNEPHWRLQLELNDSASWKEIITLTGKLNAAIIDGPSSLGIISIAVPQKNSPYKDAQALLAWVESQTVVAYASVE